ncbi:MAG: acyl-CoA thioester hydrolase [Pseudohongiellaceae bacterium]|jgi:acyl-CoA thioester hydrolase
MEINMDWSYPTPFTYQQVISESDIDGLNHTNNTCYAKWCESAAWRHSRALGLDIVDYQRLDKAMALHRAEYEYYLPSYAGEELIVATWLTHNDKKLRLERQFQINNLNTGSCIMRAKWWLICVTLSTGKATRFPREFLTCYSGRSLPIGEL